MGKEKIRIKDAKVIFLICKEGLNFLFFIEEEFQSVKKGKMIEKCP